MKKKILTAIALIAALVLSLFMAACGDDGIGGVTLKVTAKYDAEQGSVVVTDSDGEQKTEFGAGAKVVVTVTAKDGYAIDGFTVNGVDVELTNGVYGFVITANTVVEATFKDAEDDNGDDGKTPEELFAEAFNSVKTTFMAVGSYTYKEADQDPVVNSITTVFGTGAVSIVETDDKGEVLNDDIYVDKDGYLAQPYHTVNNEIAYNYPAVRERFEDYDNPFKKLTTADFTKTETKNVFALTAEGKADAAATAITGWNEGIASFTVTIGGGKVTRINITTKLINVASTSYTSVYTFTLSEWGTAEVDEEATSPYKTTSEHTALKTALQAASQAKNYTVGVYEVELVADEDGSIYVTDPLNYNIFVTEKAIYIDCEGWEEGFVEIGEGTAATVYPFTYDPETESGVLYDASIFPTIASMRASFNGFAPEIFVTDDKGTYVLRDDCDTMEIIHDVLINFAEGIDQIRLYAGYTFSVEFVLKDGALYQVELYYYVDGIFRRTLTYGDWDDTTMPISFDNFETKSVLDDYAGTYTDGTVTAVINSNGIVINDEPYDITEYSIQYDMFTGEWNDGVWYIAKQGAKQLILLNTDDDITYVLTSTAIDPVEIPEEFDGVWKVNGNTAAIAYDIVEFNGKPLTVLSYEEKDGSLYATDGDKTYRLLLQEKQDGSTILLVIVYVDGLSTAYYDMTAVEDAVIMPQVLLGTYEKYDSYYQEDYKIVITLTDVEITIGTQVQDLTISSVSQEEYHGSTYWEITLEIGEDTYYIDEYATDVIQFFEPISRFSVNLNKTEGYGPAPAPSTEVPESFYGEYEAEEGGVTYYVSISADGITVKIGNGQEKTATVLAYDDAYSVITLDVDGEEYYIATNYQDETAIDFSNSDYSIYVTLTPVGGDTPTPSVTIPEKFRATYEGAKNGVAYVVVITENGVAVSIDGVAKTVTVEEYNDTEGYVAITLDGAEYSVMDASYDSPVSQIRLMSADYSVMVTLNRSTETGDDVTIPEAFYGTFAGEDSFTHKTAKIVISADGLTVTIDGGTPVVATDLEVTEEEYGGVTNWAATFKVNGQAYSISEGSNADRIYFCSDYDSQASFQTTLIRTTETGDEGTIPEKFYGEFATADESYMISIDANGIYVLSEVVEGDAVIVAYDDYEGFTVTIDGDVYYIQQANNGDEITQIRLLSSDFTTVNAVLNRSTEAGDEATIPEAFYGTFEGEDGYTHNTAQVVISADGVTVTLNGGTPIVATDLVVTVSSYWAASFKLNGNAYEMSEGYSADQLYFMSVFDNQATFQTTLTRATEMGGEVAIPEEFYGSYMSEDEEYMIIIDEENGIYVLSGDIDAYAVIVDYDDYEGFTVTIDGDVYYIMNASYTDASVPQIAFMSSDYRTVNVTLDRVEE